MKMVKSLLLGSAAGLVAVAGAQAADMPVKAKPVQYVKICSLYGAGFYYIPGTDMCLKLGGWARYYSLWGADGDSTNGALATAYLNNRTTVGYDYKVRGYITADARNQTAYGVVRSYLDVGFSGDIDGVSGGTIFSSNRAFIQWAGFTFGLAQSFYDFYSQAAVAYYGGHINPASDTGDAGQFVTAYTAQFGNGFSGTISAEGQQPNRSTTVVGTAVSTAITPIAAPGNAYGGVQWPDIVGNLRVDQAWGAAQIMGAIHDVNPLYEGGVAVANANVAHYGDQTGWAVGAGLKLNAPMIGKGDYFQAQVNYSEGASGYVAVGNVSYEAYGPGGSYGYGYTTDAVYGPLVATAVTPSATIDLTTMWGVNASFEHNWVPGWKTSVYGAYIESRYDTNANANLCGMEGGAAALGFGATSAAAIAAGCSNNWSYYNIGTRTQWNVTSDFYLGVDVVYTHLNTASGGAVTVLPAAGTQPAGTHTFTDQDAWIVHFRVHKDFYP